MGTRDEFFVEIRELSEKNLGVTNLQGFVQKTFPLLIEQSTRPPNPFTVGWTNKNERKQLPITKFLKGLKENEMRATAEFDIIKLINEISSNLVSNTPNPESNIKRSTEGKEFLIGKTEYRSGILYAPSFISIMQWGIEYEFAQTWGENDNLKYKLARRNLITYISEFENEVAADNATWFALEQYLIFLCIASVVDFAKLALNRFFRATSIPEDFKANVRKVCNIGLRHIQWIENTLMPKNVKSETTGSMYLVHDLSELNENRIPEILGLIAKLYNFNYEGRLPNTIKEAEIKTPGDYTEEQKEHPVLKSFFVPDKKLVLIENKI